MLTIDPSEQIILCYHEYGLRQFEFVLTDWHYDKYIKFDLTLQPSSPNVGLFRESCLIDFQSSGTRDLWFYYALGEDGSEVARQRVRLTYNKGDLELVC